MKDNRLLLNNKKLLSFSIVSFILIISSTILKITNNNFETNIIQLVLGFALILQFIPWIIVLLDLFRNQIRYKIMWIIGMFAFISITVILYLTNREQYQRLAD